MSNYWNWICRSKSKCRSKPEPGNQKYSTIWIEYVLWLLNLYVSLPLREKHRTCCACCTDNTPPTHTTKGGDRELFHIWHTCWCRSLKSVWANFNQFELIGKYWADFTVTQPISMCDGKRRTRAFQRTKDLWNWVNLKKDNYIGPLLNQLILL